MLSNGQFRAAKPRKRSYDCFDAHPLFVLVTTWCSMRWRLNRKYDGTQKQLRSRALSPTGWAEARRLGGEALAKLREGEDPAVANKLKAAIDG